MDDYKSFWTSKTVWGGLVALAAGALGLGHYTLSPADAAHAVDALVSIASGVGALIAIWGRVSATRRIGAILLALAIGLLALGDAHAQTPTPAPAPKPGTTANMPIVMPVKAPRAQDCTITSCSGFYVGGHISGNGTNADILGSGLAGSVFNNGAGLGAHVGYQIWNGSFFAAAEGGGDFLIPASGQAPTAFNKSWSAFEVVKLGVGLSNLLNTGVASPSQGPVNFFQTLQGALISPYALLGGMQRNFGTGFATGAGAEYVIGGGYNAYGEYIHVSYNITTGPNVVNTENIVRLGMNRKF